MVCISEMRVVDELPLVVVLFLLVDQNGLFGAGGGEADDARAAKGLAGLSVPVPVGRRFRWLVFPAILVVSPRCCLVPPVRRFVGRAVRRCRELESAAKVPMRRTEPAAGFASFRGRCRRWGLCRRSCGVAGERLAEESHRRWSLVLANRIGFQSSLPVMGSMYFLRRKRISLVLTSASALGG